MATLRKARLGRHGRLGVSTQVGRVLALDGVVA
jgi:hypothetical protein